MTKDEKLRAYKLRSKINEIYNRVHGQTASKTKGIIKDLLVGTPVVEICDKWDVHSSYVYSMKGRYGIDDEERGSYRR